MEENAMRGRKKEKRGACRYERGGKEEERGECGQDR